MPRFVAFLRAVNVGGRTIKMEKLRSLFAEMGFANVETFIASGNVIFETKSTSVAALEKKIEAHLAPAMGYDVPVFLRTPAELEAIAARRPFAPDLHASAQAFAIGFCKEPLSASAVVAVMKLSTPIDDFHLHQREVYWLCRQRQSDSTFSNQRFERVIHGVATWRGASTIAKLVAKYRP